MSTGMVRGQAAFPRQARWSYKQALVQATSILNGPSAPSASIKLSSHITL